MLLLQFTLHWGTADLVRHEKVMCFGLFFSQPPYLYPQRRTQENQCICTVQKSASISISSSHYACLLSDEHRFFFQKWYKSIWAGGWKLWRKRQPVERHMEGEKSERYQQLANLLLHFTFICSPHLDTKTLSNTPTPEERLFPAFSNEAHSIIDIALCSTIILHGSSEFCIEARHSDNTLDCSETTQHITITPSCKYELSTSIYTLPLWPRKLAEQKLLEIFDCQQEIFFSN